MGATASAYELAARAAQAGRAAFSDGRVLVRLRRPEGADLGLEIDVLQRSGLLLIAEVKRGGLIEQWNAERESRGHVRSGDWLLSVNGITAWPSAMLAQLTRPGDVELVFSREKPMPPGKRAGRAPEVSPHEARRIPVVVTVTSDCRLGLDLEMHPKAVTVRRIEDGAIAAWNAAFPESEVRAGDRLIFADAAAREAYPAALAALGEQHLVFWRGPPETAGGALSTEAFEALPSELGAEAAAGSDVCGICLEDWAREDVAVRLPCGHRFHRCCSQQWLTGSSALCPLCQWAADCPRGAGACRAPSCGCGPQAAGPAAAGTAEDAAVPDERPSAGCGPGVQQVRPAARRRQHVMSL